MSILKEAWAMFLSGRYSGSPQTLHGDHKQVKPMPFSVHSTSVACRSLHGNVLSYTDVVI